MTSAKLLDSNKKFEIEEYKRPKGVKELHQTHVAFSGYPIHHPYDPEKVVLLVDPFSSSNLYYEFFVSDISYAEELGNIVNPDGQTLAMVRIWVKKKSLAVCCTPFVVEDTRRR